MTDLENARALVDLVLWRACWRVERGWWVWDGRTWVADAPGHEVVQMAATSVPTHWRGLAAAAESPERAGALERHARRCESAGALRAMVELAATDPRLRRRGGFDEDGGRLNTPSGVLELGSGEVEPHRASGWMTRMANARATGGACPRWHAFLERVVPDADQRAFLQRAVGYSLTGETSEQCLFVLWGEGSNGKGTFVETVRHVLGTYAANTPMETFTMRREGGASGDLAALAGPRFVTASETQRGVALNEALIKQVTGQDVVSARFMHQEFFEFLPQFKAWIQTNHRPSVAGTDHGTWRRLRLVPFTVTLPREEWDMGLRHALRAEAEGILLWAWEGCRAWMREGLCAPSSVLLATEGWRHEMDVVGRFLEDCCVVGPSVGPTPFGDLWKTWDAWCASRGVAEGSQRAFADALTERRVRRASGHGAVSLRLGIGLLPREYASE